MERLLGNEQLKTELRAAVDRDRLAHSYLICGTRGSGKHTLARLLTAAMECTANKNRPCGVCTACRKVFSGVHPDVVTVDDTEHVGVGVDVVRKARTDLYLVPTEGRKKVYLFPRAADMNANAQNALLKVLEEPPAYGAFLLLAEEEEKLLPTIRSRCVSLRLSPLNEAECLPALRREFPDRSERELTDAVRKSGGWLGQAQTLLRADDALAPQTAEFLRVYAAKDRLGLTRLLVSMEKLPREQLQTLLLAWRARLTAALTARLGAGIPDDAVSNRTAQELLHTAQKLEEAAALCDANVVPGILCGALQLWLL